MKILVGIPVVTGALHCKSAIDSVRYGADVLVIDNGADEEVKTMLDDYADNHKVYVLQNPKNVYVNPAWNQIIKWFLDNDDYEYLVIMNSDLTMGYLWYCICQYRWAKEADEILIPVINPKEEIYPAPYMLPAKLVSSGTPGVFITLNKKQARLVYPIPESIKIWFGDNWIYEILRGIGYKTVIPPNLIASTQWSQTIKRVPEAPQIIEQDKLEWPSLADQVAARIKSGK